MHVLHAFVSLLPFSITQVQRGAGLAAAVARLRPVSSQPVSSQAHSAISRVAPQRAPRRRLSAASAELSEVSTSQTHCIVLPPGFKHGCMR